MYGGVGAAFLAAIAGAIWWFVTVRLNGPASSR
jgi:hypothetical protein